MHPLGTSNTSQDTSPLMIENLKGRKKLWALQVENANYSFIENYNLIFAFFGQMAEEIFI